MADMDTPAWDEYRQHRDWCSECRFTDGQGWHICETGEVFSRAESVEAARILRAVFGKDTPRV